MYFTWAKNLLPCHGKDTARFWKLTHLVATSCPLQLCPLPGEPTGSFKPSLIEMVVPKLADRHVNAPAWSKRQLIFPFTSLVEATGRTIPKAQDHEPRRQKKRCRSFEPRFLAPGWGGVSFLSSSTDRAHSLTGAKTNRGALWSGLSSLPQFTSPATLRPQKVTKTTRPPSEAFGVPFPGAG